MMEEKEDDTDKPPESPLITPEPADEEQATKKGKKKRYRFAKISFDTKAAMDAFVDAINSEQGLHIRANKISLTSQGVVCIVDLMYTLGTLPLYVIILLLSLLGIVTVYRNRRNGTFDGCMMAH